MKKLGKSICVTAMALVLSLLCATTVSAARVTTCSPPVQKFSASIKALTEKVGTAKTKKQLTAILEEGLNAAVNAAMPYADAPLNDYDRAELPEVMTELLAQSSYRMVDIEMGKGTAKAHNAKVKLEVQMPAVEAEFSDVVEKCDTLKDFLMYVRKVTK